MEAKKKQGIYLIPAGAVVLVGVLVFGMPGTAPGDTPTATSTEPVATTTDIFDMEPIIPEAKVSTEGWKTCRNEEYGWEISYPGDWYVYGEGHHSGVEGSTWGGYYANETPCVGGDVILAEWEPGTPFSTITTGQMQKSVSIQAGEELFGTHRAHITDVYELAYSYLQREVYGFYVIAGEHALLSDTSIKQRESATGWTIEMYHNTMQYTISSGAVDIDILETMLTTFHFLDTASTTTTQE